MCSNRIKTTTLISERKAWKIPLITGLFTCLLGLACCGVGLKLLEFKKSPSLPPLIAGAPMVVAGIAGMVGGRIRRSWLVSVHAAFCLVVGVLSLHLINIFVVKEAKARELQWAKCQSNFQGSKYCHWYAATLGMAVLSVLAVTLVPLGIICCVTKKYMTSQHVTSEAKNEDSFTLDQPEEFKVTSKALPSRELRLFQRNYMKKHRGHNNRFHNSSRSPVDHSEDFINNASENQLVKNLVTNGESFRYVIDDSHCLGNPVLHNHSLENETDHNPNLSLTDGNEPRFKQLQSDVLLTNKIAAEDKSCTENASRESSHGNLECSHTSQDKACGPRVVPPSKKVNENHFLEDNITDNFSSSKSKQKLHFPSKFPSNKQWQDDHAHARPNNVGRNYAFDPKVAGTREPTGTIHETHTSSDELTNNRAVTNESGAQALGKQQLGNHQLSDESVILRVPSNQFYGNHMLINQPMEKKVPDLVADKPRHAAKMYPVKAGQKSSRSALFRLMSRQRGNMFISNTTDHSFA